MPNDMMKYKVDLLRSVGLWNEEYKEHYSKEEEWKLIEAQLKFLQLNDEKKLTQCSSSYQDNSLEDL